MQKKASQTMKVYVFRIFNLINKLYLYDVYLESVDAVYALIDLNRKGGEGMYEIHKIHYTTIQVLENE